LRRFYAVRFERTRRFAAAGLVVSLLASWPASAQIAGGAIAGLLTDASGGVLASASVTATNVRTNQASRTLTNANGYYEFPLLPAGRYRIDASLAAFQPARTEGFDVHAGTRRRLDLVLAMGPLAGSVDVVARGSLNATTTALGTVMDQQAIEALPLNGRNFQQLVGLQAGVVNAPESSTGRRGGIEFHGAPALGNNLLLDGVDMSFGEHGGSASDVSAGAAGGALINAVSVDAIAEFKSTSGAAPAEYGRATGGVLNVTTKSGDNELHGSAWEFFRHDALDANSFFSNRAGLPKPPLRWNQFGANLGGPIRRDRAFFFVNYEGARVRRSQSVTGNVPTPLLLASVKPEIRAVLQDAPASFEPTSNPYIGFHRRNDERRNDEHTLLARVDAQLGAHRLGVRYSYNNQDFTQPNLPPSHPRLFPTRAHNAAVQHAWVLSPNLFNELRLGVNHVDLNRNEVGNESVPAWVSVTTGGLTGLALLSNIHFQTTTYSLSDNLSLVRGRHSFKAGVEVRVVNSRRFQTGRPTHRYDNVAALIEDRPNNIQVIFGNPGLSLDTVNYAAYVQDDWRLGERLQLNAGLRYDHSPPLAGAFNVPGPDPFGPFNRRGEPMFRADGNNFGPRLGLIYDPLGGQRLILRAGGGVMYGPPQPLFYFDMAFIDPEVPFIATFTARDVPPGLSMAFPFPQSFVTSVAEDPSLLPPGFNLSRSLADYERADEYSIHWSGSVEYAVGPSTSLQLAYVGTHALKLYSTRPLNLVVPETGRRPNPALGEILFRENAGRSRYDALQVSLNQRPWKGLSFDAYYTWAKSTGYYGPDGTLTSDTSVQDPNDIAGSIGPKSGDVRHRFIGTSSFAFPEPRAGSAGLARALLGGWSIHGIVGWRSGLPVNVTAGRDLVGNGRIAGQRPDPVPEVDPYVRAGDGLLWLNRAAFDAATPLAERRFGRLGYNALRGPSAFSFDLALHKHLRLWSDHRLTLRVEAFNVLNHKVLGNPVSDLSSASFGQITSASGGRNVQLGVKYQF
jgi:outer membrane receptor protein involved in Fe transport